MSKKFISFIIVLHLIIALTFAYFLNIRVDEATSLYLTQKGFFWTFQNAFVNDKQAPLYFLVLNLWRIFNDSIFFARLFSIICSLFAIKFFYDLTRIYFDDIKSKFVTAFFAFHPFLIWSSVEIRPFALIILLSILLLKNFIDGYFEANKSEKFLNKSQILFIIASIFAVYTTYFSIFLLAGFLITLLILKNWQSAKTYAWQMLIVIFAGLPLIWIFRTQYLISYGLGIESISLVEGVKIIWSHFLSFIFPLELFSANNSVTGASVRIWTIRLAILTIIILLAKNKFRSIDKKVLLFAVVSATISVGLIFAYAILGKEYSLLNHASILFVPLILLVSSILINLLPEKVLVGVFLFFGLLFPYSIYKLYPNFVKHGDWKNVAEFIQTNEKIDQPIIIFKNFDALALPFHYQGANEILPKDKFFDWGNEDISNYENAYKQQINYIISTIPPTSTEIWLITRETCYPTTGKSACETLESFVQDNYTIELEKDFVGEKVRLLRKK